MMNSWLFWWMIFMLLFFVTPIGYGSGYRRWGAPYPRYIQRRRGLKATANGGSSISDYQAWRWGGDLVWMVFIIGTFWVAFVLWWL